MPGPFCPVAGVSCRQRGMMVQEGGGGGGTPTTGDQLAGTDRKHAVNAGGAARGDLASSWSPSLAHKKVPINIPQQKTNGGGLDREIRKGPRGEKKTPKHKPGF